MNIKINSLRLVLLIILLSGTRFVFAQCGTIMVGPNQQQYPSVQTNLPPVRPTYPYQTVIQLYIPQFYNYNGNPIPLSNAHVDGISGLPSEYTYSTFPLDGTIAANSSGCITIQSNFPKELGTFPLTINLTINTAWGSTQTTISGYNLICNSINGTQVNGTNTYSNVDFYKIGTTFNNQQTNGSAYRRVQVLSNNKVGVTWTTSDNGSPFLGRGTGYNQFDGSSWIKGDTTMTRIETQRAGFPSYAFNSNTNEEVVLSHIVTSNGYSGGFVMSRKNVTASSWNQNTVLDTIASVPGLLWCRTAISNNYLHVVACYTDSTQNQPNRVVKNGVRTPVVYSRYNMINNTWDIKTITLPGYNSSRYYNGISDSYSIDANGTNVALLIGSEGQDLSLWKSINNGVSWTKTIIDSFYQSPFIESKTLIDPAIGTVSGDIHVLIDNNSKSHCFFMASSIINEDTTDGNWSYYPANSNQGLLYWNEGTNQIISIATFKGDPINVTTWNSYNGQAYGDSYYLANPSAGISSDGKIYCLYSSPTEGDSPTGIRDVYITYTNDSGQSWSIPKNVTGAFGSGIEQGFPSIARTVNNKIHFTYSQSNSVGPYSAGQWDINYQAVDTGLLDTSDRLYFGLNSSYVLSDTILCKGQPLVYNIINSSLHINGNLIASGNENGVFIPQSSGVISIKSIDGKKVFKLLNLIVIDSLNLISQLNGVVTNSEQVSLCGLNKQFQFGVTSSYTGNKAISWKLNDSIALTSRMNLMDTFTQAGKYSITVKTSSGCMVTKQLSVTKNNNVFNLDFTANPQIITSPPFNVYFTNATPQLANYKFYWSWGDGKVDTTEANIIIPKTYSSNGNYSVGLIAQNKTSACRDSITKVSYIICAGATPQPLTIASSKSNPICVGTNTGTITINPSGGTAPYTYRINGGSYQSNNTFYNLAAGIYDLEVKDALNSVAAKKDTLIPPAQLQVGGINGLNGVPIGSNQVYSILPQSGVIYSWNIINGTLQSGNGTNSIQVLWSSLIGVGKVIVTIQKGVCFATDTLNVFIGGSPIVISTTKQNESCPGKANGFIHINVSGGIPPYNYAINSGTYQSNATFSSLVGGIYEIKVKDSNQLVVKFIDTITTGAKVVAGIINGPTTVPTLSLQNYIIGQQAGCNYFWNSIGGIIASGQSTNIAQVSWGNQPDTGSVRVIVTNSSGCSDTSTLKVQIGTVGVNNLHAKNSLCYIYPNPTKELLTIDFGNINTNSNANIQIHDMLGRLVYEKSIDGLLATKHEISVSGLSTGNYILTIKANDKIEHQKFVKE